MLKTTINDCTKQLRTKHQITESTAVNARVIALNGNNITDY
jgi:chorismate-pyruvate lyase